MFTWKDNKRVRWLCLACDLKGVVYIDVSTAQSNVCTYPKARPVYRCFACSVLCMEQWLHPFRPGIRKKPSKTVVFSRFRECMQRAEQICGFAVNVFLQNVWARFVPFLLRSAVRRWTTHWFHVCCEQRGPEWKQLDRNRSFNVGELHLVETSA